MTDRTETVLAEAAEAYFQGLERDGYRPEGCSGAWAAEHILAALKAARIAVVELPEVSQEDLYHQYWISIAPNASIKYEYDGSWDSSEHVREFATALLAAADIAEASQ